MRRILFTHLHHLNCSYFSQPNRTIFQSVLKLNSNVIKNKNNCFIYNIRNIHFTFCKSAAAQQTTDADNNPAKDVIVYTGTLTTQIKGLKIFSITSSTIGIALQPILFQQGVFDSLPMTIAAASVIGFFTFVTPFLIHVLTRKYVTEISYHTATDSYTAKFMTFFLRTKLIHFQVKDIEIPDIPPIFTTFYIKGFPVFVVSEAFHDVSHFIKMMGYDKPIDLRLTKLNAEDDESENKTERDGKEKK